MIASKAPLKVVTSLLRTDIPKFGSRTLPPWKTYKNELQKLIVIGNHKDCKNELKWVTMNKSVVGQEASEWLKLKSGMPVNGLWHDENCGIAVWGGWRLIDTIWDVALKMQQKKSFISPDDEEWIFVSVSYLLSHRLNSSKMILLAWTLEVGWRGSCHRWGTM